MKPIKSFSTLFAAIVMLGVMLTPAVRPIITPPASARVIISCLGLTTGAVALTDSHGYSYTQTCGPNLKAVLGYPGLYPTEDAPTQAIITVRPMPYQIALPGTCQFRLTSVPIHVSCVAVGLEPLSVDLDLILTMDIGGGWV